MYAPLVKQKGKIFFLKVLSSLLVDLWSSHCPTCCTTKLGIPAPGPSPGGAMAQFAGSLLVSTGARTPTSLQSLPALNLVALSHVVLVTEPQNHRITKSQNHLG